MTPTSKSDADAILRVAGYHRRDFDLVVIRSPPHEHAPVISSILEPFPLKPKSSIGKLKRLPPEITSGICRYMDISSCFRFRQTCKLARHVLSCLPEYRAIVTHGLESFRAVLRTGVAAQLTLCDLYRTLCTMRCVVCGSFGSFLYLPTAERCCFSCLGSSPELCVVSLSQLSKVTRLSSKRLRQYLLVLHTLPGVYTMFEKRARKGMEVVGKRVALETLQAALGIDEAVLDWGRENDTLRYMATTALPWLDRTTGEAQSGISCKGCQVAVEERTDEGLEIYTRRDRVLSREEFLTHFKSCREAQLLWKASHSGTVTFEEPEVTKRRGFLSELGSDGQPR